ncbi:MAG: HAD family hydrolase [Lachnospiraceae bacterium]|nr:HAD family hydrolase [Lachnospiraceae bacterium]
MKQYQYLLFDLDGTLTDPGKGIRNSVAYALDKMGLPEQTESELNRFIGPPLQEGFQLWCGLEDFGVDQAVTYYREYYQRQGMFENTVYNGIRELLLCLREQGSILAVATSKPEIYARQILDHFQLSEYFHLIAGGNLDGTRCTKTEVIRYVLNTYRMDVGTAVMIGDRKQDILGAIANHLDSIGVLYGYGSREELDQAGAHILADSVGALAEYLKCK